MTEQTTALTLRETMDLGSVLVKSGYFNDARDASQAVVKVLAGREMGFGPIASMQGIHIIQGKPSIGANLLGAAVKRTGKYNYRVPVLTDERAEIAFFENGEEVGRSVFTMADAKAAGLNGKDNWKKYPRNMLFSRALSNGARWYCPDVFSGVTPYTPEELGAPVDGEGEVIDVTPTPVQEPAPAPSKPEPEPKQEPNGNDDGINSPAALLAAVNEATTGYYNAIPHMLHAIKKHTGDDNYRWPNQSDMQGYMDAYQILIDYAEAQKAGD